MALKFNKRASDAPHRSYANVVYSRGDRVEGVLYELTDNRQIFKMDPFEGAPLRYSRDVFLVDTEQGMIPAWVYVANRAMITEGLLPARWYLEHLLAGRSWLSDEYYQFLSRTACLDAEPTEPAVKRLHPTEPQAMVRRS